MGTRVTIDGRGIISTDDANSSGGVSVNVPLTALAIIPTATSMSLGNTTLSSPGFYWIPGNNATGTLPAASVQPGAIYIFSQPSADLGIGAFLTGSSGSSLDGPSSGTNPKIFFLDISGSVGNVVGVTGVRGNNLTMPAKGSVRVISDGKYWCVQQLSGSVTLT